jgi:NADPH oxidase
MLWNIAVNDAGADYDPLTLLRTRTMYGRPDWKSIYSRIRMAIEGGNYLPGHNSALKSRVGTYFCGPSALGNVVQTACLAENSATVKFSFAKEHF